MSETEAVLRQPAEVQYAGELARLIEADKSARPPGWQLSPQSVRKFITGDETLDVSRKFYGDDALVDRAIVALMGTQGLMLVGEPGTAKSMLSELLAAAISGQSGLVVQGSAGAVEDHFRYGWNYALLLAEGPSERALTPSPLFEAMRTGAIARVEELTRCPPEVQDAMISILSEKTIAIPELGQDLALRAKPGFSVIATANLRDRGVHDMSSALKRRFNFETVHPIDDPDFERVLIMKELEKRWSGMDLDVKVEPAIVDVLVAAFQDLRNGRTRDGVSLGKPAAVMSTAEAVNVAHAATLEAGYLDGKALTAGHVARQLQGVVLKDDPEDGKKFRAYIDHVAKDRARHSKHWKAFHTAARDLKLEIKK
ncbi:MAG: AAA family ATPase [Alphaproteobacteria bacterium]|nr:AAA family ATPase [Alphaproteobacteria bacterium]